MDKEKNNPTNQSAEKQEAPVSQTAGNSKSSAKSLYAAKKKEAKRKHKPERRESDEFEQRVLDVARVTRVMAGGKRMRFRACVAVGNRQGLVGVGLGKGADVTIAVNKAVNSAKKAILEVPIVNDTIPHEVYKKFGAAKVLLKPARKGRGVIAGGVVRIILELSGIKNVTSKILGTNNKVNVAQCTIEALRLLKPVCKSKENKKKKTTDSHKNE
ncbi:30S ribosomal protein S5 [Candidatus Parcubacteria bacterium]|nr:MAG: 30S ribosomal protein S5 [Candidatus Parcubacteria bacterium]